MGSRIMHLIIAHQVANTLEIKNKTAFLLGGIAADATSDKEASHFYIGKNEDYTRKIDYEGFLKKYIDQASNDFILGYYSHLIADEYWLSGFYLPWLKNRIEAKPELLPLYHQDFQLLNGKLIEHYGVKDELITLLSKPTEIVEIEEIQPENLLKFTTYVIEDMNYEKEKINSNLNVFTFEQIIGYIETSVEKSLFMINSNINYSLNR
jgi:hypothetical protein